MSPDVRALLVVRPHGRLPRRRNHRKGPADAQTVLRTPATMLLTAKDVCPASTARAGLISACRFVILAKGRSSSHGCSCQEVCSHATTSFVSHAQSPCTFAPRRELVGPDCRVVTSRRRSASTTACGARRIMLERRASTAPWSATTLVPLRARSSHPIERPRSRRPTSS